jgi:hypothetical protein
VEERTRSDKLDKRQVAKGQQGKRLEFERRDKRENRGPQTKRLEFKKRNK